MKIILYMLSVAAFGGTLIVTNDLGTPITTVVSGNFALCPSLDELKVALNLEEHSPGKYDPQLGATVHWLYPAHTSYGSPYITVWLNQFNETIAIAGWHPTNGCDNTVLADFLQAYYEPLSIIQTYPAAHQQICNNQLYWYRSSSEKNGLQLRYDWIKGDHQHPPLDHIWLWNAEGRSKFNTPDP